MSVGVDGPILAGLHIDKTGGTSVQAHAAAMLGDGVGYSVSGALANATRVMRGDPLFAEYPPERVARIRLLFGHVLKLEDAFVFPEERLRLFTIVRDPFERFVSRYKHYLRRDRSTHHKNSARAFFEATRTDSAAAALFSSFGRFTESEVRDEAALAEVLANLDYVLWTGSLDHQGSELFALLGVPPMSERHRVYPETPDLDGLTRDDVAAANPLDSWIAEVMQREGAGGLGNPFGRERVGRERARQQIAESGSDSVEAAYVRTFDFMHRNALLPAAKMAFERRALVASSERLGRFLADRSIDLSPPWSADEEAAVGEVLVQVGAFEEAATLLAETVERHPDHFLAQLTLARAYKKFDKAKSRNATERAVALNGTNEEARHLLYKLTRSKKEREAARALAEER